MVSQSDISRDEKAELLELFAVWRNEGLMPLSAVIQCAKLLLEGKVGELNKDQRQLLETIHRSGLQAADCWYSSSDYVQLRYGAPRDEWNAAQLAEIVNSALAHLEEFAPIENIKVNLPDNLPPVRANAYLGRAFVYLLDSAPLRDVINNYPTVIQAKMNHALAILIQIHIEKQLEADIATPSSFFSSGTHPSVAQLIVRQHGSEIQLQFTGKGTEFQFELPVWHEGH